MVTMTVQIPNAQVGWFEQMARNLGWSFSKSDTHSLDETKTQKANSDDLTADISDFGTSSATASAR